MKKRMTSLLVVLCLVFALIPTALAASASDFPDVKKGTWYYDAVDEVVSNGYFLGQGDGTFAPHKAMTRAMFVTVLSRVDGAVVDNSKSSFSDVPAGAWYTGAVTWAAQNSIVLGVGGDKFDPNRNINRVDMCLIMSRYISYYAAKTGRVPAVSGVVKTFGDTASLSASNKEAVEKCVSYGLIVGDDYGNFKPASNATRAEVAVIISRLAWITTGGGGTGVYNRYYRNYPGGGDSEWTQMYLGTVQGWAAVSANAGWTEPDGYDFDGWNTKPDGSGTDYEVSQAASRLFLYAQWKPEKPDVVDHINVAMDKAVDYANTEINRLYDKAYDEVAELLKGSSVLNDVKAFKEGTTFDLVLTDHTIDVTFVTDLSNDNPSLKAMVNFAVNYAKEVYASETTKQDVKDLATKVEEHLKTLLKELGVEYEGSTMRQKLTAAAKSLAELGKGKAVAYRDELKKIFKNVDLKNLNEVAKSNGTTSVLGVTVSANGETLVEADKDISLTRDDIEAAAQKAHEVVQTVSKDEFGGQYESVDKIAEKITGKLVFEPAEAIAQNYKAAGGDYDAEYTVKFHVTTGTGNYLQYKFDGQYDHFRFAPTQGMWNTYVDTLNKVKSQVVSTLTNKNNPTAAGPAAAAAPYAAFSARFIGFTAPIAGDPSTVANSDGKMSLVDMINKMDEAFKELHNDPEDKTVKNYMKKWKEDNAENLSEDDMIKILIGEKELDTEGLKNDTIMEMVDQLVTDVSKNEKVTKNVKTDKPNGWDGEELQGFIEEYVNLPERVQDVLEAAEDFGMTDYVYNALANEFNENNDNPSKTDEFYQKKSATQAAVESEKGKVEDVFKEAVKDQMSDTDGLIDFAKDTLEVDVDQKIKDNLGENVSLDDVKAALKLFEDAQNPEALVLKTLGGAVDSMDSEVIKKVVEKRWENYSARVDRVLTRIDNALTRVLNSRFGDTVEGATIQIGEKGNVIKVSDLQKILRDDYSTYAKLVNALHTFVYETANIEDLSIQSLANTLITVSAGKYTYSFYVEIDLSKVA